MIAAAHKILFVLCINIHKATPSVTWLWIGKYVLWETCVVGERCDVMQLVLFQTTVYVAVVTLCVTRINSKLFSVLPT